MPALLYTIPTHQNPSGTTLSSDRRTELVRLAHEFDFTIVADEAYQLLGFPGAQSPPPMRSFDAGGDRVVSLGSFSKILAPAMRLGWIEASPAVIDRLIATGALSSGGAVAPLSTAIAQAAIGRGTLQSHLASTRASLCESGRAMNAALDHHLPGALITPPTGGYFAWARLPGVDTESLLRRVAADATPLTHFLPGGRCCAGDAAGDKGLGDCLRLSFSFHTAEEIRAGVAHLAAAVSSYRDEHA